jgi:hypothetical protein
VLVGVVVGIVVGVDVGVVVGLDVGVAVGLHVGVAVVGLVVGVGDLVGVGVRVLAAAGDEAEPCVEDGGVTGACPAAVDDGRRVGVFDGVAVPGVGLAGAWVASPARDAVGMGPPFFGPLPDD